MENLLQIRKWLTKNKIFLEILAWFGLGIMSFIVSWKTLEISSKQAEIDHIEHLPKLRIENNLLYNEEKKFHDEDIVIISNEGYDLTNFRNRLIVIYKVTRGLIGKGTKKEIYIPVNRYYSDSFPTNNMRGEILTVIGHKNNRRAWEIEMELLDLVRDNPMISYQAELIKVLFVSYKDYLGNTHKRYFLLEPIYDAIEISQENGSKWLQIFDTLSTTRSEDIETLSAKKLIGYFENSSN